MFKCLADDCSLTCWICAKAKRCPSSEVGGMAHAFDGAENLVHKDGIQIIPCGIFILFFSNDVLLC